MESILTSVKKLAGLTEEYDHFDPDIIMYINSVFMILNQVGVGPEDGFYIEDYGETWDDYSEDMILIQGVKTYVSARVRKMFDPPSNSTIMQALNDTIREFEWRLNLAVDP